MSKYTLKKSINRAFSHKLIDGFIIRQQEEKLEEYYKAQAVALDNKDFKEAERVEQKISELLTEKI